MDFPITARIKLLDFGSLKAVVDVRLGSFEIRGFKIIEQDGRDPWVATPSREFTQDGQKTYYSIIRFHDPAERKEFNDLILKLFEEARRAG